MRVAGEEEVMLSPPRSGEDVSEILRSVRTDELISEVARRFGVVDGRIRLRIRRGAVQPIVTIDVPIVRRSTREGAR